MASMNIKADPTIVRAATGAAMAGVPFSMAGMYDGLVKEYGDLMDNISDNFQKNLTNINSVNSEVKEKIKELASIIQKEVGHKGKINWDFSKPDGTPKKLMDSSKMNKLGWKPNYDLVSGIKNTYSWFLENTDSFKQVKF